MIKNVIINNDVNIKTEFDSFYELNKEYESPYYTLKHGPGKWAMENPVNFSFYPPKNATKLILKLGGGIAVVHARIPEKGTYSYMRVKFPVIGSIDIRNNVGQTNNPYEYTLKNDTSKLDVVIEKMEVYSTEISGTNDELLSFQFMFK